MEVELDNDIITRLNVIAMTRQTTISEVIREMLKRPLALVEKKTTTPETIEVCVEPPENTSIVPDDYNKESGCQSCDANYPLNIKGFHSTPGYFMVPCTANKEAKDDRPE